MQVVKAPTQGRLPKGTKKVTGLRFQCNPVSFLVLTCLALSEDQCTQGQSPRPRGGEVVPVVPCGAAVILH